MTTMTNQSTLLDAIREALPAVVKQCHLIETLEKRIGRGDVTATITAVRTLHTSLKAFADVMAQEPFDLTIDLIIDFFYAVDRAEEAILQLVVYRPVAESTTEKDLRQRRQVAYRLHQLIEATQRTIDGAHALHQPARRSAEHLRLLSIEQSAEAADMGEEVGGEQ